MFIIRNTKVQLRYLLIGHVLYMAFSSISAIYAVGRENELPRAILAFKENLSSYPLLEQSMRDPEFSNRKSISIKELHSITKRLKYYRKNVKKKKGVEKIIGLRDYLNLLLRYSYYWGDALNGRSSSSIKRSRIVKILSNTHKKIRKISMLLYKKTKLKKEKRWILFQNAMINFIYSKTRKRSLGILRKLQEKNIGFEQQRIVELALNLVDIDAADDKIRLGALRALDKLQSQVDTIPSMLAHLAIAKGLSGLNSKGMQIGKFNHQYRNHLNLVSRLCRNLSAREKEKIFRYSLTVWKQAKDFRNNWKNIPFKTDCYENLPDMLAIKERIALQEWSAKRFNNARKIYQELASQVHRKEDQIMLEERVVELSGLLYQRDDQPLVYQRFLVNTEKKYRGSLFGIRLQNIHYKLLMREIRKAKGSGPEKVANVERLMKRYLETQLMDFRAKSLKVQHAELYIAHKMYAKAEKLFGKISLETQGEVKKRYLDRQVLAQTFVAKWSMDDPWNSVKNIQSKEREHLLRLYYKQFQMEKSLSWLVSKHIGLLEIDLGRVEKAYFVWENALKSRPNGQDPRKALGLLIDITDKSKSWFKLEELIYLGLDQNIIPLTKEKKKIDVRHLLEKALYNGAVFLIGKRRFDTAITKLLALEKTFEKSPKTSEYLYLLATAYKEKKNYEKSLDFLELILTLGKKAPYFQKALTSAANIHIGMANIDAALKMYHMHLQLFPKSDEQTRIMKKMVDIYISQKNYQEAAHILARIDTVSLQDEEKIDLEDKIFYVRKNLGDGEKMLVTATNFLRDVKTDLILKLRSYHILAEHAYQNGSTKKLAKLERDILSLDPSNIAVADTLSYLWHLQVKLLAESIIRSFKKVLTQDFQNTISFLDVSYKEVKKSFSAVCHEKVAAYCIPSMQDLISFNYKIRSFLADITSDGEQDKKIRESFIKQKEEFLQYLLSDLQEIKRKTFSLLSQGNTIPSATKYLLWQNLRDWNFSLGGESGTGFMQISKDYIEEKANENL